MKTVAHLVGSLDYGGIESQMEAIASCQGQGGYDHRFCALEGGGNAAKRIVEKGGQVDLLECSAHIPSLAAILALLAYLRRVRPQVLHCHGAEANFHGLIAGWIARIPVRIAEEVGIPSHSLAAKRVFGCLYRTAHKVVAVSDAVRLWLIENKEASAKRTVTIHNPVLAIAPGPRAPDGEILRVAFVGRLEPVKNLVSLIEAMSALSKKGLPVQLWVIGDGSDRERLENAADTCGLRDKVKWWGFQDDPMALVRQCTIFVQPSLTEGFSLALIEAMACEIPVIATCVGGAPDVIEEGRTGWLIDPTPGAIAAALSHAWEIGPTARAAIGQRAGAVPKRFAPEFYREKVESLYTAVSAAGGR
jgi:glycosyltransferase involved in cell wall biosynthesis